MVLPEAVGRLALPGPRALPSSLFRRWRVQGLGWGNEIGGPSEPRLNDPVSAALLATQVPHIHRCPAGPGRRPLHVLPLLHLPTDRQVPRAHHPAVPPAGRGVHALRHRRPCPAQGEPGATQWGPAPRPTHPRVLTTLSPLHRRSSCPSKAFTTRPRCWASPSCGSHPTPSPTT